MKLISAAIISLAMTSTALARNCDEERTIEKSLNVGSLTEIEVSAGAGELIIEGVDETGAIGIVAKLCASDKDLLAKMDVRSEVDGDVAEVETKIPSSWSGKNTAKIDLLLTVPSNAQLKVKDSSGDLEISDVAKLNLTDSSGGIELKNIEGEVELTDSSGGIYIRNVGSATVTDSSGSIDVKKVVGDFTVNVDSSGDIEVDGVGGSVLVKVDSSGSIEVENVEGDFIVERDGSGGISYDDIAGEVSIPSRKR